MHLQKKQLELQKQSIKSLEEKFTKKMEASHIAHTGREVFERKYLKKIGEAITKERREAFQTIIKKLYLLNKEDIESIAEETINTATLIKMALENSDTLIELIESKKISTQNIYKKIDNQKLILYTYNKLIDELKDINHSNLEFKQVNQLIYLTLLPLTSYEIVYIMFQTIIKPLSTDLDDTKEHPTSRQGLSNIFAIDLFEHVKYKLKQEDIKIKDIENKQILQIGFNLFKFFIDFKIVEEYKKEGSQFEFYRFTEKFEKDSKDFYKNMLKYANPFFEPMIIPPTNWTTIDDGGFLKDKESLSKYDLYIMKTKSKRAKENLESIRENFSPKLLEAINIIQATKWKINHNILRLIVMDNQEKEEEQKVAIKEYKKEAQKLKKEIDEKKISLNTLQNLNIDAATINQNIEEIKKELTKLKNKRKQKNNEISGLKNDSKIIHMIFDIAKKYQEYKAIYFVWQIDFRGRVYPVQTLLNPQGNDMIKSLLHFAEKKLVDEKSIKWLKIHGANCYGKDKISFDDRVKWIDENSQNILDAMNVTNPLESEFIQKASKKFQFLAFALEYKEYIKNPKDFKSSIPIAMDGSNNGFQHIATLLKDTNGAQKVNVLPNEEEDIPADIYKEVAKESKKQLLKKMKEFEIEKESLEFQDGYYWIIKYNSLIDNRNFIQNIEPFIKDFLKRNIRKDNLVVNIDKNYLIKQFQDKKFGLKKASAFNKAILYIELIVNESIDKSSSKEYDIVLQTLYDKIEEDKKTFENDIEKGVVTRDKKGFYVKKETERKKDYRLFIPYIIDLVDRSMVKSNVMTDSYGSSTDTKAEQITEYLIEHKDKHDLKKEDIKIISSNIAIINEKSIDKIAPSSQKYKGWMKKIADKISKKNKPIHWKTPSIELDVIQEQFKTKKESISTKYNDINNKIQILTPTQEIDAKAQKSSISPNFIHSLDATHLYMTILNAHKENLTSFATIHDSYATHASDIDVLLSSIKKAFIELYSNDVLGEFKQQIELEFGLDNIATLKVVDKDFNLNENFKAKYFFS